MPSRSRPHSVCLTQPQCLPRDSTEVRREIGAQTHPLPKKGTGSRWPRAGKAVPLPGGPRACSEESGCGAQGGAEPPSQPPEPHICHRPDRHGLQGAGLTLCLPFRRPWDFLSFSRFRSGAAQRRGCWEYSHSAWPMYPTASPPRQSPTAPNLKMLGTQRRYFKDMDEPERNYKSPRRLQTMRV